MRNVKSMLAAFVLAAGVVAPSAPVTRAETNAIPGGPFNTAFRVQNLGATAANCAYTMYDNAGASQFNTSLPAIAPGDSGYVYTPAVTGFPAGTFAGVVSCDQEVAVVVNFSDADKGDAYVGTKAPANTLYAPSVYNNYFNYYTSMRIQNASATAQNVTVEYYAPGSSTPAATTPLNIPGNGAVTVDQQGLAGLNQNVSYSARIVGSAPLAAMISIFGGTGTGVANQLYAYSAFSGGSTTPIYAPVIMRNYYGYNTATTIQNLGTQSATVTMTYSNGTVKNLTIPSNSSQVVLDLQEATLNPNVLYGATIQSSNGQPLIVTVNESTPTTNRASTYEAMPAGGTTIVTPIVMKEYYRYNSSVTCQNIGSSATEIRVSYSNSTVSNKLVAASVAPGATQLIYQPAEAELPAGYIGSATITGTQPLVCVANQDKNMAPETGEAKDFLSAYDGLIKP